MPTGPRNDPHDPTYAATSIPTATLPAPHEPLDRERLGPYLLLAKIGQGGMGAVYRARHTLLNRIVALKVLPDHLTSNKSAVARFNREMKAVGELDHPQIVKATDAGEFDGIHYLAMELVDGHDLHRYVKSVGPLSIEQACGITFQAARGLSAVHGAGLVHRDIKPSNLFLTSDGQVKILDLGLVRLGHNDAVRQEGHLTDSGQILGTPDFMAPEQWDDTHSVSVQADLYALGCTLFYLLLGRAPYQTDEYQTLSRKIVAHAMAPIPDLRSYREEVPLELSLLISKLLAKSPADRVQSADELCVALAGYGSQMLSLPQPVTEPLPAGDENLDTAAKKLKTVPPADVGLATSGAESPTWAARNRRLVAAAGVVTSAAIVLAIVYGATGGKMLGFTGRHNASPEAPGKRSSPSGESEPNLELAALPPREPPPTLAPFDALEAKRHQQAWADFLNVPVNWENSQGMKFQLIPPGSFELGAPPSDSQARPSERPQHRATISRPFYMAQCETTQQQYVAIMGQNPSTWTEQISDLDDSINDTAAPQQGNTALPERGVKDESPLPTPSQASRETSKARQATGNVAISQGNVGLVEKSPATTSTATNNLNFPVESVTWEDAQKFCGKLSTLESRSFRLPTEAEWEYAARAGTATRYPSGDDKQAAFAMAQVYGAGHARRPLPVGSLAPNAWGLFDMNGNVREWCLDWYGPYGSAATVDPAGSKTGFLHVYRGGCYFYRAEDARTSFRYCAQDDKDRAPNRGFRVIMEITGSVDNQTDTSFPK